MEELPIIVLAFANEQEGRRYLRDLPEELRRLQDILEDAEHNGLCRLELLPNATLDQIFDVFTRNRDQVTILHYAGHADSGRLLLESSAPGGAPAHAAGLATFLGQCGGLQLVFLNGCSTRAQVARLLEAGVAAVIATARAIDDGMARAFAVAFYTELAAGFPLRAAYEKARGRVLAAHDTVPEAYYGHRDLGTTSESASPDPTDDHGFPWEFRPGTELVERWSLPDAAGNPEFGLPHLPDRDLPETPFRHLNWFTAEHAEVFFGRGYQVRELYEEVIDPAGPPILLLYGASGVGKSSLLDAGLVPRLEAGGSAVRYRRRDQKKGLLGSLRDAMQLSAEPTALDEAWRAEEARLGERMVVFLDQVEEVFTRPDPAQPRELDEFLTGLAAVLSNRETRPQGKLVLGFRKEWLAELDRRLAEAKLPRTPVFLKPLDRRGIIGAIRGPARAGRLQREYRLAIEDGLPDVIADDLLADAGSALSSTLQVLLTKMWERARQTNPDQPRFDRALYESLKSEGYLLKDVLDAGLKAIGRWNPVVGKSGLALDVLAYHTTELGTAAQRTRAELEQRYAHHADALDGLLGRFKDNYLLVEAEPHPDSPTRSTRLAHDLLAPLVQQRFRLSVAPGQRACRLLENRAPEWRDGKTGPVLDGADLASVEDGASGMRVWTTDETRLVEASRRAEEQQKVEEAERVRRLHEAEDKQRRAEAETQRETERSNKRLRKWAVALAAVLVVTVVAAIFAGVQWLEAGKQRDKASKETRIANEKTEDANKAEHKARLALGQSLVSEGAALQRTGLIGQRFDSLDRLARAAQVLGTDPEGRKQLPEIRNHAIAALELTDLSVRQQYDGLGFSVPFGFSVDAALERYAVAERSGPVVVRRLDDNRKLVHLPGPDQRDFWYACTAFSPDGELLVADYLIQIQRGGGERLRVWHLGRQELIGSLPTSRGLAFHPDGRRLLFGALEGGIAVWDRRERRVVRRLPLDFTSNYLALDPEGRRIAVNNTDAAVPRVAILELETGRVLADWRSKVGVCNLAWSADGQFLAVGGHSNDPCVYVWNVHRGALASVLQGHTNQIINLQFAHSGYLLATASWDGTTRLWNAAAGEPLARAPNTLLGFSPDDRRLAFTSGEKIGVWDVAAAPVCQTLHPGMRGNTETRDATVVSWADISPDGRLVATSDGDGVRLWEADTGRELAHLKAGYCDTVLFHPEGRSLISSGKWGIYRWPIHSDPDRGPAAIRVGPPELLRETVDNEKCYRAAWLPDQRTLALLNNPNHRVLLIDSSHPHPAWSRATALDSEENRRMTSVAVSPDGRWLAVGGWKEAGVRVWDLRRHRLVRKLRPKESVGDMSFFIGFSPDGRWLVSRTGSDVRQSYHFWRIGTWNLDQRIDQERGGNASLPPAFTRDGRLMALGIAPDQVLLAETATGRELARLTKLQLVTPTPLVFSPDGTKLVATTDQKTVLVWDLRRIRDQLAPMGLDWDAPPYPAVPSASHAPGPVPPPRPVQVVGEVIEPQARRAAELAEMNRRLAANPDDADALIHRGWLRRRASEMPEAIVDLERAARLRPDDADALSLLAQAYLRTKTDAKSLNNLAWRLATGSAHLRDPKQELVLAQEAVALTPGTPIFLKTLGVAQYRVDQYATAIATLEKSLAGGKGQSDAFELFFLAMAHRKLGQTVKARADFDHALDWRRDHPNLPNPEWSEELNSFQAEAEALLNAPLPALPPALFAPGNPTGHTDRSN